MDWVTVPDVRAETWRRLQEFANSDVAMDAIAARHGMPRNKAEERNYRKQARQVRMAIEQAREYFDAACAASPITSPNPLYYGMTSLTSAVMLLLGTGDQSLDRLRQDAANRHHGLQFSTGADEKSSQLELALLAHSQVAVRDSGYFINWYGTLPPFEVVHATIRRIKGRAANISMEREGWQEVWSEDEIKGRKFSLIDLIRFLPDMRIDLWRCGVQGVAATRTNLEVEVRNDEGLFGARLHNTGKPEHMDALLESFRFPHNFPEGNIVCEIDERATSGRVAVQRGQDAPLAFQFPSVREEIDGVQVMYAADLKTKEIVDAYLLGYGLSMLARYFPDLWVACLDSHCRAAKVVERAVSILVDKFPMLALSEMVSEKVVISTHRPPWHT